MGTNCSKRDKTEIKINTNFFLKCCLSNNEPVVPQDQDIAKNKADCDIRSLFPLQYRTFKLPQCSWSQGLPQKILSVDPGEWRWISAVDSIGMAHVFGYVQSPKQKKSTETQWAPFPTSKQLQRWHAAVSEWMVQTFQVIVIPFRAPPWVTRRWHYDGFIQTLIQHPMVLSKQVLIVNVDESHSTQICAQCGATHKHVRKKLQCQECGWCAQRDLNAAMNLMYWYLFPE